MVFVVVVACVVVKMSLEMFVQTTPAAPLEMQVVVSDPDEQNLCKELHFKALSYIICWYRALCNICVGILLNYFTLKILTIFEALSLVNYITI